MALLVTLKLLLFIQCFYAVKALWCKEPQSMLSSCLWPLGCTLGTQLHPLQSGCVPPRLKNTTIPSYLFRNETICFSE